MGQNRVDSNHLKNGIPLGSFIHHVVISIRGDAIFIEN